MAHAVLAFQGNTNVRAGLWRLHAEILLGTAYSQWQDKNGKASLSDARPSARAGISSCFGCAWKLEARETPFLKERSLNRGWDN